MRTKITVRKEDIDSGVGLMSCHCPVALALKRDLGFEYVSVGPWSAGFGDGLKQEFRVNLPKQVTRFIAGFDSDESVKPFSFTISIPSKYLRKKTTKRLRSKKK